MKATVKVAKHVGHTVSARESALEQVKDIRQQIYNGKKGYDTRDLGQLLLTLQHIIEESLQSENPQTDPLKPKLMQAVCVGCGDTYDAIDGARFRNPNRCSGKHEYVDLCPGCDHIRLNILNFKCNKSDCAPSN